VSLKTERRLDNIARRQARAGEELGEFYAAHTRGEGPDLQPYRGPPTVAKVAAFAEKVLSFNATAQQREIFARYCQHPRAAVRSAVGIGKTDAVAVIVLFHVYVRRGLVVSLAASDRQVRELLWGAIRRLWHRSGLPGELYQQALQLHGETRAIGFVTTDPSKLRGWHQQRLLVCVDEAQGVPGWTWESITALVTGEENQVLAIGNPGPPVGSWYNMHRNPRWSSLALSALDHPNLREGREVIPGGPSAAHVEYVRAEYGAGSAYYRATVLGEFSEEVGEGLLAREWIDAAIERWHAGALETAATMSRRLLAALDVARFGPDRSCLALRDGPIVRHLATWGQCSTMETLDRTLEQLAAWGMRIWPWSEATYGAIRPDRMGALRTGPDPNASLRVHGPLRPGRLIVDAIGVGGPVVDRARERGLAVDEFMASRSPDPEDQARFLNARMATAWRLRRVLEDGAIALPPDEGMIEELLALRYVETPGGKLQLEPKEETKNRIGHSPDIADALMMLVKDLGRGARFQEVRVAWA